MGALAKSGADPRQGWSRIAPLGWGLALLLAPALGAAQPVVYHSPDDDGVNPNAPLELEVGPNESVYLYLDGGSQASQGGIVCKDGDGEELCGWEVLVQAAGPASFTNFFPEPGVVYRITPDEFEANGLLALDPALGPVRIGELWVSSSDTGGEIIVTTGQVVRAALQVESVSETVLATTPEEMPEPSGFWQLAAGALLLAGLVRGREPSRRRSGRDD